jgi:hypothetical protein
VRIRRALVRGQLGTPKSGIWAAPADPDRWGLILAASQNNGGKPTFGVGGAGQGERQAETCAPRIHTRHQSKRVSVTQVLIEPVQALADQDILLFLFGQFDHSAAEKLCMQA